jgi:hypothetical protein
MDNGKLYKRHLVDEYRKSAEDKGASQGEQKD